MKCVTFQMNSCLVVDLIGNTYRTTNDNRDSLIGFFDKKTFIRID